MRPVLLDRLFSQLAVEVQPFALCLVSTGCTLRLPGSPAPMLHFMLEGKGLVRSARHRRHAVGPRWLVVVPPGMAHSVEPDDGVASVMAVDARPAGPPIHQIVCGRAEHPSLVFACGIVSVRYGQSVGLFDHLKSMLSVDLSDTPQVGTAFQAILNEQSRPGTGQKALLTALMTECLVHLFRHLGSTGDDSLPWLAALQDERLARVLDRMVEHPSDEYTVESLAEVASMSRSAFAERFAALFGRSPMNLLQHVRMQRAAELLEQEPALSVDDVAGRVGYASRSRFSDAFRKHHGVPPVAFRASH